MSIKWARQTSIRVLISQGHILCQNPSLRLGTVSIVGKSRLIVKGVTKYQSIRSAIGGSMLAALWPMTLFTLSARSESRFTERYVLI